MYKLRDYKDDDSTSINELAVKSFVQFKDNYNDWEAMKVALKKFSGLSSVAEIIVATDQKNKVVGAVAYVPAQVKKAEYFPLNTPIIRMLVVDPDYRGKGIGKALSEACIKNAKRDGSPAIALHTSEIMAIALPMYLAMGFVQCGDAPDIFGVPYHVYSKNVA